MQDFSSVEFGGDSPCTRRVHVEMVSSSNGAGRGRERSRTPAVTAAKAKVAPAQAPRDFASLNLPAFGSVPRSRSRQGEKFFEKPAQVQAIGLLTPFTPGQWTRVPADVKDSIMNGHVTSMESLFGEGQGIGQLIELSLAWFADDNGGADLQWYQDSADGSKRRSIEASRLNRDLQEQTVEEYKHRLLQEGQPQSVAGHCFQLCVDCVVVELVDRRDHRHNEQTPDSDVTWCKI